jgi:chemotaxis protein MotB
MIKKITLVFVSLGLASSCVSKKTFNELENKVTELKKEKTKLSDENTTLFNYKTQSENVLENLKTELTKAAETKDKLKNDTLILRQKLKIIDDAYGALEKNSNIALADNLLKNKRLLSQIESKSNTIALKQESLNKNNKRLNELETLMAQKEQAMRKLKETLSKALNGFEGRGLTVEQKNGKVYVSMENKLLFESGSWSVGPEGRKAVVELGKVLGDNPEISVLIEGHTDNDPYESTSDITNNWDLSTKRATSIVVILCENKAIIRKNLTAAGRGEYAPLGTNATAEGKAKNRRIEIILTPRLDAISKMLNSIN